MYDIYKIVYVQVALLYYLFQPN